MTTGAATRLDLRRAPLQAVRAVDLRAPERDLWADERALWDRFVASWAGLDDAAWRLPGAAPSDAGGPDWSLHDHVAHVAFWQELAIDYTAVAERSGQWPSDDDFDGGDFDRYNERMRSPWDRMTPAEVRRRLNESHDRLLAAARRLSPATIRSDEAWGWLFMTLHGHQLDHLGILEPWADRLRERQAGHDPFVDDPRPPAGPGARAAFWAAEDAVMAIWHELLAGVPEDRWQAEPLTPGWTLRDHVAHLADWFEEGAHAVGEHARTGVWLDGPEEGFDTWNERALDRRRGEGPAAVRERFASTYDELRAAVDTMTDDELRSEDGWSWTYECLHGHVRSHLAMIGPWCARVGWPAPPEPR